ncbi:hypothetical protein DLB95_10030 [Salmonella enterica subsp. diarizonae]|uniref:Uncharacterized protein n=3 Tax=Salmonella enterica TaxID=28901 RepID=A0A743EK03_SALER|nr:hypothetical protein [Salmonella enterica subsp. enterica serovar Newport]EAA3937545.1 hypothetical protein [Salmonella enterica subsp. enterica serovar Bareilly]EAP2905256.1 hypothetical protein [Salmonella enterica]ECB7146700.1 hypothetical protein [Salmonella enterica subsp. enterica serovar Richmond]ECI8027387.1 hypothetical protein [Salmonella enterica subsp. enterica serovar Ramatgan]ECJ4377604.1 hypothetical protein [Salmonella enterica subsp. diarizonae]ECW9809292.1 hypothetical pr
MTKNKKENNFINSKLDWFTINETLDISTCLTNSNINRGDIYRYALSNKIILSIYFQSPIILRRASKKHNKMKLTSIPNTLLERLCFLDSTSFINNNSFITCSEGKYITPKENIIDTSLNGHEYVSVQHLLAHSLEFPPPVKGKYSANYGISVLICGEIFQAFEKTTWQQRISQQLMKLPEPLSQEIRQLLSGISPQHLYAQEYFPLYDLPPDACFVIRRTELDKLLKQYTSAPVSTRTSSALARLFWLACWHNESIRSLIGHPYKLLPIFEQWASEEGITDNFSAETIKAALERGSPFTNAHRQ